MRFRRLLAITLCTTAALPAAAHAIPELPGVLEPVPGNPAERLRSVPIEDSVYDRATHCSRKERPGTTRLVRWLERNAPGANWGVYRCEKWGKGSASLHAAWGSGRSSGTAATGARA